MSQISSDSPILKEIEIDWLIAYLEGSEWKRVDHPNPRIILFEGPLDDDGEAIQLILPRTREFIDANSLLAEALNLLVIIENEPIERMVRNIQARSNQVDIDDSKTGGEDQSQDSPIFNMALEDQEYSSFPPIAFIFEREPINILNQGVKVWNQWREDNPQVTPNFHRANLSDKRLSEVNFAGANLIEANLCGAKLSNANLIGANLTGVILSEAALTEADLTGAFLRRAEITDAYLSGATLTKADLTSAELQLTNLDNANFEDAYLGHTAIKGINLMTAYNLRSVKHVSVSSIDRDTLASSMGKIPEEFLRGCGLSDWEIEQTKLYNPDLTNEEITNINYRIHDLRVRQAFQINPLFISYSHSDSDFVDALESRLIFNGVRFWRDIHHAKAGKLEKQIDTALRFSYVVLIVLSEHSTSSDWVEHEVRRARAIERWTNKDALCPIALDDSWKTSRWPEYLREAIMNYNILNFSNWRDEAAFNKQFSRLLEGLNLFYK